MTDKKKLWFYVDCHIEYEAEDKEVARDELKTRFPNIHIDSIEVL